MGKMDDLTMTSATAFLAHLEDDGRGQLLRDHLLSVSQDAGRMSEKIGLRAAGAAIGLLHDLGKYSRDFQRYLRRMTLDQDTEEQAPGRGTIDHSTAGAQTIWRNLKSRGKLEGIVGEILSVCIASHHSGLIDCIAPDGTDKLSRRMSKVDLESHYEEAWATAEQTVVDRNEQQFRDPELVAGVRDFIARLCRIDQNDNIVRLKVGLLVRILFSCLIDADRTDTADSSKRNAAFIRQYGSYVEWPVLVGRLEHELNPAAMRRTLSVTREWL
jgi:CRISPR-associated endonuclease/helicase Cas3